MSTQPTVLSQLRHLYQNMLNGGVRDAESAKRIAEGLLGPAIEALERGTPATGGAPILEDVTRLVQAAQAFVLAPSSLKKKIELEAQAWGPLADTPQPVQEPLTQPEVVEGFCKEPHSVQYVSVFNAGVRFAERHHGITGGQHG